MIELDIKQVYVTGNSQIGSGVKQTYIVRAECANIDRFGIVCCRI
jgi:hypothetical protein